jgi:hypothetical protein
MNFLKGWWLYLRLSERFVVQKILFKKQNIKHFQRTKDVWGRGGAKTLVLVLLLKEPFWQRHKAKLNI